MANSADLARGISRSLGLPASTAETHVRVLREAGLIAKSGRGTSAARMGIADAAKLLCAAITAPQVNAAAAAVRACEAIHVTADAPEAESRERKGRPRARLDVAAGASGARVAGSLDPEASFLDGVRAIFEMAAEFAARDRAGLIMRQEALVSGHGRPLVEVRAVLPAGQIVDDAGRPFLRATIRQVWSHRDIRICHYAPREPLSPPGDLLEERVVSFRAFEELVEVLAR